MATALEPLTLDDVIVDQNGTITQRFRLLWEQLIARSVQTALLASLTKTNQNAALALTVVATVTAGGVYRLGYYLRKTIADGVSSSVALTVSWVDNGSPCSHTFAALATDTNVANDSGAWEFRADASSDVSISIAYASNTPGTMHYNAAASLQQLV